MLNDTDTAATAEEQAAEILGEENKPDPRKNPRVMHLRKALRTGKLRLPPCPRDSVKILNGLVLLSQKYYALEVPREDVYALVAGLTAVPQPDNANVIRMSKAISSLRDKMRKDFSLEIMVNPAAKTIWAVRGMEAVPKKVAYIRTAQNALDRAAAMDKVIGPHAALVTKNKNDDELKNWYAESGSKIGILLRQTAKALPIKNDEPPVKKAAPAPAPKATKKATKKA
jgi:hypothetical protein